MWEFLALAVCAVAYVIIKLPDWRYEIKDRLDKNDLEKRMSSWTVAVVDRELEASAMKQVVHIKDKSAILDKRDAEIKAEYSEYGGKAWFGSGIEREIVRVLLARRGKLCEEDALLGINGMATRDNILFIRWINERLKEHNVDYPVYFVFINHNGPTTAYALDAIPGAWEGKFMWGPAIKRGYKMVK